MPKYIHDCTHCRFLATEQTEQGEADFYICGNTFRSLVIRLGDDGADYHSMPYEMARTAGGIYWRARQLASKILGSE